MARPTGCMCNLPIEKRRRKKHGWKSALNLSVSCHIIEHKLIWAYSQINCLISAPLTLSQTYKKLCRSLLNGFREMKINFGSDRMIVTSGWFLLLCRYWNSRLATERQRLLNGFTYRDVVCMFASASTEIIFLQIDIYYLSSLIRLSCFCLWILLTVGYFSFLVFVIVMYSHKSRIRRRIPISFNSYMLSHIGGRKPKREKIKKE